MRWTNPPKYSAGNLRANDVSSAIREIRAIDVHAHYGKFHREGLTELRNHFFSGDVHTVLKRAQAANTDYISYSHLIDYRLS